MADIGKNSQEKRPEPIVLQAIETSRVVELAVQTQDQAPDNANNKKVREYLMRGTVTGKDLAIDSVMPTYPSSFNDGPGWERLAQNPIILRDVVKADGTIDMDAVKQSQNLQAVIETVDKKEDLYEKEAKKYFDQLKGAQEQDVKIEKFLKEAKSGSAMPASKEGSELNEFVGPPKTLMNVDKGSPVRGGR